MLWCGILYMNPVISVAVECTTTARFYAPKIGLILSNITYREVIARVKGLL